MNHYQYRIIYTSDIHASIQPFHYGTKQPHYKGLLRFSSYIKSLKEPYLLLDNGDTIQGNPLMDRWYQIPSPISPMNRLMNAIGYHYVGLGNHDFNYGIETLHRYTKALNAPVLCANILNEDGRQLYQPFTIVTIEHGIRIGIIGVVTQYIPHWERPEHIKGLVFLDAFDSVKVLSESLKDKVDVLVVLYHGGFEKDPHTGLPQGRGTQENEGYRIASECPIDLLLTGHQHLSVSGTLIHKTMVLQPSAELSEFGEITLSFEFIDSKWRLVKKEGILKKNDFSPDPTLITMMREEEEMTQSWLDKKIATVISGDYDIRDPFLARLNRSDLFDFVNECQLYVSAADISSCSFANHSLGFLHPNLTRRDLVSTFLYPNSLYVIQIDGKALRLALEKSASYFTLSEEGISISSSFLHPKAEHYNYDIYRGIDYVIDLNQPVGSRITYLTFKGKNVTPNDKFKLVTSNYRAIGGGDYSMFESAPILKEMDGTLLQTIESYLKDFPFLKAMKKNHQIITK